MDPVEKILVWFIIPLVGAVLALMAALLLIDIFSDKITLCRDEWQCVEYERYWGGRSYSDKCSQYKFKGE